MLNNCLKDTLGNGEVKVIVDKCKRLAQRTHQSTKDWYEIKQECESLGCNPIKLIQPVQTRWNSNAMLFKSVLRNEQGLKSVRDNSLNANLTILIPSDEDFQVIAELHPFLAKCQEYSEIWSSDKTPTVHKIQQNLFSLITMCRRTVTQNTSGSRIAKDAMTRFIEYLETRIPDKGTEVNDFNLASVFDPFYRGYSITLIKGNKDHLDGIIDQLVDNHPTTREYNEAYEASLPSAMPNLDEDMDDFERMAMENDGNDAPTLAGPSEPPLKMEFKRYLSMQKPAKDVKVLEWWKVNQKELPLLAAMARKYLCPPVTSCSSERLFSLGGNIISDKRHNMKPETLQKIMFIKENFPLVKSKIRSWDKKCPGEPDYQSQPLPSTSQDQPLPSTSQGQPLSSTTQTQPLPSPSQTQPQPSPSTLTQSTKQKKMKSFLKPNESQSQSLLQRAKKRKLVLKSPMKKSPMKKNPIYDASKDLFNTEASDSSTSVAYSSASSSRNGSKDSVTDLTDSDLE
ncbi:uncharacterized protein LOC105846379 isoform X1 [Hydra vulgaris]|nr:uncharacterized protein LOC105846379 [Hydra vulgaris]XP_047137219.1 uncharacterized protein LOC105846379 [Hydra vulgaris]XP_047137220.1 uncharacterized protein LOC105846379 [Hydra vulgaris]